MKSSSNSSSNIHNYVYMSGLLEILNLWKDRHITNREVWNIIWPFLKRSDNMVRYDQEYLDFIALVKES